MANKFILQIIMKAASTLGKSVINAYKQTIKNSGGAKQQAKQENPFADKFNKAFASMNLTHTQMTEEQAQKILQIAAEEVNPNSILDAYYRMYNKNSIKNGGSFYIQSKIYNAKEFLIQDFPGAEEEYKKENNMDGEQEKEQKKDKETEKEEENKEKKQSEATDKSQEKKKE